VVVVVRAAGALDSFDADRARWVALYAPERFPQILRAQVDLMVQAMACGITRVGVIQARSTRAS